jgi:hypothetical protein
LGWEYSSMIEYLPSMHEALGLIPSWGILKWPNQFNLLLPNDIYEELWKTILLEVFVPFKVQLCWVWWCLQVLSTWEAEAVGLKVWAQPELLNKMLSHKKSAVTSAIIKCCSNCLNPNSHLKMIQFNLGIMSCNLGT